MVYFPNGGLNYLENILDFHFPLNLGKYFLSNYGEKEHAGKILVSFSMLIKVPNFLGKKRIAFKIF